MNKSYIAILLLLLASLLSTSLKAQDNTTTNTVSNVEARSIFITTNKTTSLIFPFAIKSVDRGSQDVLARQVDGVDNILQLKAAKEDLLETNVTVITADGNLYSFLLNYKTNPAELVFKFSNDSAQFSGKEPKEHLVRFKSKASSDAEIVSASNALLKSRKRILLGVHDRRSKMNLILRGVYIKNDVFYFQLECKNLSKISYDVDMLRFFIRDQHRSKRTAVQEVDIKPLGIFGNHSNIKAESSEVFVVTVPKFTIPYAKYFTVLIGEKNGGRNLRLNLMNHLLVGARPIIQ